MKFGQTITYEADRLMVVDGELMHLVGFQMPHYDDLVGSGITLTVTSRRIFEPGDVVRHYEDVWVRLEYDNWNHAGHKDPVDDEDVESWFNEDSRDTVLLVPETT